MSTQSNASHAMFDPLYHFAIAPLTLFLTIGCGISLFYHRDEAHVWVFVMAFTVMLIGTKTRMYALKTQDRIIRLEEQVRLHRLMPSESGVVDALTIDQLVGLRFASDAEAPALARRAVKESLDRKAIKAAVVQWRPDNHRC